MPKPPSLVGNWVTSFISYYPVGKSDALLPLRLLNRFTGWIPDAAWNSAFTNWEDDPQTDMIDRQLLELLMPAPIATLTCFTFESGGTFSANVSKNVQFYYENSDWNGTYTIQWMPSGVAGGDIVFLNPPPPDGNGHVHVTMKFLLVSKDELKFITAYGAEPEATGLDLPQVAAGTLQRVH